MCNPTCPSYLYHEYIAAICTRHRRHRCRLPPDSTAMKARRSSSPKPTAPDRVVRSATSTVRTPAKVAVQGKDGGKVRLGEQWWERDAHELKATPTRSKGLGWYACYVVFFVALAAVSLYYYPTPCTAAPIDYDAIDAVPARGLFAMRVGSAIMVLIVQVKRLFIEVELEEETIDRRGLAVISHGFWRYQGLTQWQFGFVGLYFALAATLQWDVLSAAPNAAWLRAPSTLACATGTVLGVAFSLAVLTTVIVTFVLVPGKLKKGISVTHFFNVDELLMHNANSFLLVLDLLASRQRVSISDMPYTVFVGTLYVSFHHFIRYPRTRTLLYFFLTWQGQAPFLVLCGLLSMIMLFFVVGVAVCDYGRSSTLGWAVVLFVSVFIMKLRNPDKK